MCIGNSIAIKYNNFFSAVDNSFKLVDITLFQISSKFMYYILKSNFPTWLKRNKENTILPVAVLCISPE